MDWESCKFVLWKIWRWTLSPFYSFVIHWVLIPITNWVKSIGLRMVTLYCYLFKQVGKGFLETLSGSKSMLLEFPYPDDDCETQLIEGMHKTCGHITLYILKRIFIWTFLLIFWIFKLLFGLCILSGLIWFLIYTTIIIMIILPFGVLYVEVCDIICNILERYEEPKLAATFLAFEAVSIVLDLYGQSKQGFRLITFLLSTLGFIITIYICFKDRTTAASRPQAERQLGVIDVVFSVVQLVTSFAHFIFPVLGVEYNFDLPLLPLAYAIIALMFSYRKNKQNDRLQKVKVYFPKTNRVKAIDLRKCRSYSDVKVAVAKLYGELLGNSKSTIELAFSDNSDNMVLFQDETWDKFRGTVRDIHVLSSNEATQM